MALADDLAKLVAATFQPVWDERNGTVVPDDTSVTFKNEGVHLNATVLYADLADSTRLVQDYKPWFAAEIYKTFLYCAQALIRTEGGTVTAYDGDRVMGVFIGDKKNDRAVRCGMKIGWAVDRIIKPVLNARYTKNTYQLHHVVGIDTSKLFVAKTGARGANDLVWVGRAANYAAKLAAEDHAFDTYITEDVYNALTDLVLVLNGTTSMWDRFNWSPFGTTTIFEPGIGVYRSTWIHKV